MIKLELKITKKKEIKENNSKYDFLIKVNEKVFHLMPKLDDIRLVDFLLDDCDELPEEITVEKNFFENQQGDSIRFYALYFKIEEDNYYLNVDKADKKLFNFLIDKIDEKNGEEPF